jgi:hypothetical protein
MFKQLINKLFKPKPAVQDTPWKMPETPATGKKTFFMDMPEPMEEQSRKHATKNNHNRCRRKSRQLGYKYPNKRHAARARRV